MIDTGRIVHEARTSFPLNQTMEMNECLEFLSDKNLSGFIEVGSAGGGSFYCWASVITDGPKISVDLNHGFGLSDGLPGANTMDNVAPASEAEFAAVRARNEKWRTLFNEVITIEGNSMAPETVSAVDKVLQGRTVGWVFIDAWHEYFAVKEDLKNYSQFLHPDGYIGFHDINQDDSMRQFWSEIKSTYKNTIEIMHGTGLGIIPAREILTLEK